MSNYFGDGLGLQPAQLFAQGSNIKPDFDIFSLIDENGNRQAPVVQPGQTQSDGQYFVAMPKQRRKRQPWTDEETKRLLKGVHIFGKGNWAIIHQQMQFSSTRTTTDIKDKWRNLIDPRKNARTPKDLKRLAEVINREQNNVPGINRAICRYISQPQMVAPQISRDNSYQEPEQEEDEPESQQKPAVQVRDEPQSKNIVAPKLFDMPDPDIVAQPWDPVRFNDEWEN